MCCTNACPVGARACGSATSLQTCSVAATGCTAFAAPTACATDLICARRAPADCVNPHWADWPAPNNATDVTGGAPNPASFTDNGDRTVADNVTGLMWQQDVRPDRYNWNDASRYCASLSLGGHADWRLPSLIEMFSIVDNGRANPAIDPTYFPGTSPSIPFWSSTPVAGSQVGEFADITFNSGGTFYSGAAAQWLVRCVR